MLANACRYIEKHSKVCHDNYCEENYCDEEIDGNSDKDY